MPSAFLKGIQNHALVPCPSLLSKNISPCINSTRLLLMVRPKPVPPYLLAVDESACEKGVKSFFLVSSSIPIPVSSTWNSMIVVVGVSLLIFAVSATVPSEVNFMLFVNRFCRICLNLPGSPITYITNVSGYIGAQA